MSTNAIAVEGARLDAQRAETPPASSSTAPICGIYGLYCEPDEKWYVGQSINVSCRVADHFRRLRNGKHTNSYLQRAFNKYGEACFLVVVLELADARNRLPRLELKHARALDSFTRKHGFNQDVISGKHRVMSVETREKISKARKGMRPSAETRRKLSEAVRRRAPASAETREKIAASKRGKPRPPHVIEALRRSHVGKPLTKQHRQKLSKALSGRRFSEEHRRKIGEANRGKKMSVEAREKMAAALRGMKRSLASRKKQSATMRANAAAKRRRA